VPGKGFLGGTLVVLAAIAAAAASAAPGPVPAVPQLPPQSQVLKNRAVFLKTVQEGLVDARTHWWNPELGWYNELLRDNWTEPLVMLWSMFHLWQAVNGVAVAAPTAQNVKAAREIANYAESYYNPDLKPVGAYAYYPGKRDAKIPYYFDDNGWFGISFLDAYRITKDRRYLTDAIRAFRFLDVSGWSPEGGFWWETNHLKITSEPLAAGILLGARLYKETKNKTYLERALKWLAWADRYSWNAQRGLYQRSSTDDIVMSYVEGLMAAANAELCQLTKKKAYCTKAALVARNSLVAFSVDLHWAPQYDAVYLYGLLALYKVDRNRTWYALAYHNALRALASARDADGLFLRGWAGETLQLDDIRPNQLGSHGATLSVFSWLAAAQPPAPAPAR
jgi:uncharacterized protein YyaL (SSP411 family)